MEEEEEIVLKQRIELYSRFRYIQTSNSDGDHLAIEPLRDSTYHVQIRLIKIILLARSQEDLDSSLNVMSTFVEKILDYSTSEDALILITDHRLILLPNILKRKRKTQKVGIMLFQPFPHYDWFRNSCIREEILRGILGADLVTFISSENAYHFVDACTQILGYKHTCIDGNLFLDCEGRQLLIHTIPVTIDSSQFLGILAKQDITRMVNQLKNKYLGKKVILAVDEIDSFKGIQLQFMAVEYLLCQKKEIVFIQMIKGCSKGGDISKKKKNKVKAICETINIKFGVGSYSPVVVEFVEDVEASRVPYYAISDCLINLCLTDMIYQIAYEYLICKQNSGHLLVSEFLSCSTSLKGVIRVNPRKTKEVAEALATLLFHTDDMISQTHLQENHTYIRNNGINVWPKKIFNDLHGKCKSYAEQQLISLGDGLKHMLILHDKKVVKLNTSLFKQSYKSSTQGVIFIDFDQSNTEFDIKFMVAFEKMCKDNQVFLFTKMSKEQVEDVFGSFISLTVCAENGFCLRLPQSNEWVEQAQPEWKVGANVIMDKYSKNANGVIIETTGSQISCNFNGITSHLRSSYIVAMLRDLRNAGLDLISTCYSLDDVVYVQTQEVNKGVAAKNLVETLTQKDGIDFGLCIGFGEVDKLLVNSFEDIPVTEEGTRQFFYEVVTIAPNMKTESGLYLNNWEEFVEILGDLYGEVGESSYSGLAD